MHSYELVILICEISIISINIYQESKFIYFQPKKRPASAKSRICYIAPKPKQKIKSEEDEQILIKERLYKVEVFTSDQPNAGTSANVIL